MAFTKDKYERLTSAHGVSSSNELTSESVSLWLGDDHLLLASASNYNEKYRRMYFRDIQAIQTYPTNNYKFTNFVIGIIIAISLIVTLGGVSETALLVIGLAGLLFASIILIVNLRRGPTCRTIIRTAVQIEDIPSLRRDKKAARVIERLRPLIETEQTPIDELDRARKLAEIDQARIRLEQFMQQRIMVAPPPAAAAPYGVIPGTPVLPPPAPPHSQQPQQPQMQQPAYQEPQQPAPGPAPAEESDESRPPEGGAPS
jgi:hypothetical protein